MTLRSVLVVVFCLVLFLLPLRSQSPALHAAAGAQQNDLEVWYRSIEEYTGYYQRTYGPEIKSRYQLYLKERQRMSAPEYAQCLPPVLARRTLTRWVDGIIFEGRHLPGLLGRPIQSLRVLAHTGDRWQSIPYQIDEWTAEGVKVLPAGPSHNASMGNGLLDKQDEIVLMAHDTGDRVEASARPAGVGSGQEVEVVDPVTGGKGWFYVFAYETDPPDPAAVQYRTALIPTDPVTGYLAFSPYYLVHGKTLLYHGKTYNQIFYNALYQSPLAGGSGTDYVDRMKWRLRLRFLFGTVKIGFDEDSLTGEFFAWQPGPVRGTYRVWAVANLPMGLKSPRIVADVIQVGENIISTTTQLHVPFNPGTVITDLNTRIGTDLAREATAMRFYNSNTLSGTLIDGRTAPAEANLSRERDQWRLIYGPQACLLNRSYWSPDFIDQAKSVEAFLVDDAAEEDPPESSKGQYGAVYSEATVGNIKAGDYAIGIEWYFLNDFYTPDGPNLETLNEYLLYQDNPVQLNIQGEVFPNKSMPTLGKSWE